MILVAVLGGTAVIFNVFISPITRLFSFDPIFCVLVLIVVALSSLSLSDVKTTLRQASVLYYSSSLLTSQLLAQYQERLQKEEWTQFQVQYCWRLFGFGLPMWALLEVWPLGVVLFLQLFQGAAAGLL